MDKFFYSLSGKRLFERKRGARFIAFEGADGAGKTTQAGILKNELERCGAKVYLTKEPTNNSDEGRKIMRILASEDKPDGPMELQKLFVEDRKWHLENGIIPALNRGEIVICDRYFFSTFAYGAIDAKDVSGLEELNRDFILPDMTIILLVDPEKCIHRLAGRANSKDFFERVDKLTKVNEAYKKMRGKFKGIVTLDGEGRIEDINLKITALLKEKLGI